jgi:hypothetical protein
MEGSMYINFESFNKTISFNGEYVYRYTVESKKEGHIGSIYFVKDANGIGSIEWCKGNIVKGYGVKIDLEELLNLLEKREVKRGE